MTFCPDGTAPPSQDRHQRQVHSPVPRRILQTAAWRRTKGKGFHYRRNKIGVQTGIARSRIVTESDYVATVMLIMPEYFNRFAKLLNLKFKHSFASASKITARASTTLYHEKPRTILSALRHDRIKAAQPANAFLKFRRHFADGTEYFPNFPDLAIQRHAFVLQLSAKIGIRRAPPCPKTSVSTS